MVNTEFVVPRAKAGRPFDLVRSERVSINGRRKRGVSSRSDATFAWLDAIPDGRRFDFVWDLLTAALNGELGSGMKKAVEDGNIDKVREAASKMFTSFVVDDD